jgi:hypothetical protein
MHIRRRLSPKDGTFFSHKTSDSTTSQYVIPHPHHTTTTTTHNTMAPHSLPVRGNSNAADTTTTNTTSAEAEVSNDNATIDGNAAEDSWYGELFDGDVDFSDDEEDNQFSQDSAGPSTAAGASAVPEALGDFASRVAEIAAGRANDDYYMPGEDVAGFQAGAFDFFADNNGNEAGAPASYGPAPAAAADGNIAAPVIHAPVGPGVPAKNPVGRPRGKGPPRPQVTLRCRYGCTVYRAPFKTDVALRKHMMRVHCIFSSAHQTRDCLHCGREYDPGVKELICNKGVCREPTAKQQAMIDVEPPRDEQEEADTFAYADSGPNGEGPSALVIVKPGDNEEDCMVDCREAIRYWRPAAVAPAQPTNGLLTPEKTPSPSQQSVIDLTGDDEEVPASPMPATKGKGKERAIDLTGEEEEIPAPPSPAYEGKGKKRAVEFSGEPEPKRRREVLPAHQPPYNGLQTGAGPATRHDSRNDHVSLETQAPAIPMAHPVIGNDMGAHISADNEDFSWLNDADLSAWI